MMKRILQTALCMIALSSHNAFGQEAQEQALKLLIHPVYTPDVSSAVHKPLANYIATKIGREIELVTPRDFHKYWLDTRAGEYYDLILEDSHIADYRRQSGTHTPLVRAKDDIRYMLLSSDPLVREPAHLIGLRISTLSSPSLGHQMLARWFSNPMAQPQILSNSKSWLDSVEAVFATDSDAAVVPSWIGKRYPNLTPVLESDPLPGLTLSVGDTVDAGLRRALQEAMIALDENSEDYDVLNELNVTGFVTVSPGDYEGLSDLLNSLYTLKAL